MRALVRRPCARPSATGATTSSAHRVSAVATRARSVGSCSAPCTVPDGNSQSASMPFVPAIVARHCAPRSSNEATRAFGATSAISCSAILRGSLRAPRRWRSPNGLRPGCRRTSTLRFGLVWLLVALAAVSVSAQPPATNVEDPRLYEVAAQLRCVVCQNLSVADSPSEMAQQMRVIIRERLVAGESPAQITQYFVDKYGEWILLSPRRSGFNLLLWGVPIAAIAVGLIVFALLLRRWTSRARATMTLSAVDAAMSEWSCRDLDSDHSFRAREGHRSK